MVTNDPGSRHGGPLTLVICDDHRVLTDALQMVVRADPELHLVAPPAHSAAEAVELCARLQPDVVLMDLSFAEDMNGLDATRAIRAASPSTGVVIMTAYHDDHLQVEAFEAGASGYLSKSEGVHAVIGAAKAAARGDVLFDARELAPLIARVREERAARHGEAALLGRLTQREQEVLSLLAEGRRNDEIAARLFISPLTVQTHVRNILGKLGVRSRYEAIALVLRNQPSSRLASEAP